MLWLHHNRSVAAPTSEDDDKQPKASDVQVGVLGLGVMGKDAAAKLNALGFKVAGWSASPKSLPGVVCFSGAEGLKRLLAQTDMLVVLLPLTEATRGIVDASLLSQLKGDGPLGGPILINAGRGGLQVEAGTLAALDSGALRSTCSSPSRRERIRPSGRTLRSMSARTMRRCPRPM
jgi:glyoxylate/hydroxypyruvate reductase A